MIAVLLALNKFKGCEGVIKVPKTVAFAIVALTVLLSVGMSAAAGGDNFRGIYVTPDGINHFTSLQPTIEMAAITAFVVSHGWPEPVEIVRGGNINRVYAFYRHGPWEDRKLVMTYEKISAVQAQEDSSYHVSIYRGPWVDTVVVVFSH